MQTGTKQCLSEAPQENCKTESWQLLCNSSKSIALMFQCLSCFLFIFFFYSTSVQPGDKKMFKGVSSSGLTEITTLVVWWSQAVFYTLVMWGRGEFMNNTLMWWWFIADMINEKECVRDTLYYILKYQMAVTLHCMKTGNSVVKALSYQNVLSSNLSTIKLPKPTRVLKILNC